MGYFLFPGWPLLFPVRHPEAVEHFMVIGYVPLYSERRCPFEVGFPTQIFLSLLHKVLLFLIGASFLLPPLNGYFEV